MLKLKMLLQHILLHSYIHVLLLLRPLKHNQHASTSQTIYIPYPTSFHHQVQFPKTTLPHFEPQPYFHPHINPFSTHLLNPPSSPELSIFSQSGTSIPPHVLPTLLQPPTIPTYPSLTHP